MNMVRIFAKNVIATLIAAFPGAVLAQGNEVSPAVAQGAAVARVGFGLMGLLFVLALLIVPLVFWVLMVVDAFKRRWPDRTVWIIVLLVSLPLSMWLPAALVYYFIVKRKNLGAVGPSRPPAPPMPPPAA